MRFFLLFLCGGTFFITIFISISVNGGHNIPALKDPDQTQNTNTDTNNDIRHFSGRWKGEQICSSVDVVYTWVNGSDPAHVASRIKYGMGRWDSGYREYGVLKYSVRSVFAFMPWVRNIVIVTNGQVPSWANIESPRLRIVTHDEIFENPKEDLPTFNSNAIEANLRNIPNIAPCFLYLNDDMLLGSPVSRDTFFDKHGNLKLHMSRGYRAPMKEKMAVNGWHRSVGFSNTLLNQYYYPDKDPNSVTHQYAAHTCYFMRTDILQTIGDRWHKDIARTSSHRSRESDDTAMPFMHANVALEEFGGTATEMSDIFGTWGKNHERNMLFWNRIWTENNICVCMNDNLDNSPESAAEIANLQSLFEAKFPNPSPVEKGFTV